MNFKKSVNRRSISTKVVEECCRIRAFQLYNPILYVVSVGTASTSSISLNLSIELLGWFVSKFVLTLISNWMDMDGKPWFSAPPKLFSDWNIRWILRKLLGKNICMHFASDCSRLYRAFEPFEVWCAMICLCRQYSTLLHNKKTVLGLSHSFDLLVYRLWSTLVHRIWTSQA